MRTRGAIIRQVPGKLEVVDLEVDDPREGEIQVQMVASGLCHSDDHVATGGVPVAMFPFAVGHEGAGIVTKAGANHKGIKEGDHVVFSFLPACGHCRWCASGMQNLCDLGAGLLAGSRWGDPTDFRLRLADSVGGIGINAVQGAAHAGAANVIAVDPVAFKREKAMQLGATHAVGSMAEAAELARQFTNGQGADSAIVTVGVTTGEHVAQAVDAVRKEGTAVVTGLGDFTAVGVPIPLGQLTLFQKRRQGSLFGQSNPNWDILNQIELYPAARSSWTRS
jgi:S-(hydroxymethyl)glutathione dehydrogenase/alcohol dehydrogenase